MLELSAGLSAGFEAGKVKPPPDVVAGFELKRPPEGCAAWPPPKTLEVAAG